MNKREKTDIKATIEIDGFDYTFLNYSDFKEIKDNEFHMLRTDYILAAKRLKDYLGITE